MNIYIDFGKGLKYITLGLNEFVDKIYSKNKNLEVSMSNWKSNVLNNLKDKTNTLTKNKQNHKKHAPVLKDPGRNIANIKSMKNDH